MMVFSTVMILSFQNCAPQFSNQTVDDNTLENLFLKVKNMPLQEISNSLEQKSKDLTCIENSDCVVLPVGQKACGGPSSYLIASSRTSDLKELEILTNEITSRERAQNLVSGGVSTCSVIALPSVVCADNKCQEGASDPTSDVPQ
jgi:hypothetical protein